MEQDDKVSAIALSLRSMSGPGRMSRANGGHGSEAGEALAGGSVASETAMGTEDSHGSSDNPASELLAAKPDGSKTPKQSNNVRKIRIERMMSKAELARRANLSVLTIDRVERGYGCRVDTKRKILEALGLSLADRVRVFGEEE
jgi:DNA-binding XRE family transcriptional regulator